MTAIVVDDEPLARVWLKNLLERLNIQVVGEGSTGAEAIQLSQEKQPDIAFLDIRMPDHTGMEAIAALAITPNPPHIVLVTGYSEHAVEAFEKAAFDYLLKPVSLDRLARTLQRIQRNEKATVQPETEARLAIRMDYAVRFVRIQEIECVLARQRKVFIRLDADEIKSTYTLTELESLLPSAEFLRVHSSAIVALSRVEQLDFLGNHTYSVRLRSGLNVPVGRGYYPELLRRLSKD